MQKNKSDMHIKKVYLTIDDGPSIYFKEKVDYLLDKNIVATFFCGGLELEQYREDVIYAIKRGFLIGNHAYEHKSFSEISIEEAKESIYKTDKIIDDLYKEAAIKREIKVFRFPYLDKVMELQDFLKELGYVQPNFEGINLNVSGNAEKLSLIDVDCTFDHKEYYLGDKDAIDGLDKKENILSRMDYDDIDEGRSLNCTDFSDIILIHDHEHTNDLFFEIIDKYIEKGIVFLPIK